MISLAWRHSCLKLNYLYQILVLSPQFVDLFFFFCFLTEIIERLKKPPPVYRPVVPPEHAPPECLQLMKQCWAEAAEQRPTFDEIFNQVRTLWSLALPRSHLEASLPRRTPLVLIILWKDPLAREEGIHHGDEAWNWLFEGPLVLDHLQYIPQVH